MQTKRLYNLDYLRGLAAFGIMLYHYSTFLYSGFTSAEFLGRIGIYGVSLFYILSGLTLFYVYSSTMQPSKNDLISFAKKRFFRIYPLLWLATILSIILTRQFPFAKNASSSMHQIFSWLKMVILNLSGLFGVTHRGSYFATGAWSIGNELVFYLFFPVFILLKNKSKLGLGIISVFILAIYLYFSFSLLHNNNTLADQWITYINPLNQVFLFLGGFLIGILFKNMEISKTITLTILLFGVLLFVFYPVSGDQINLVTGINRMVFTLSCFLITFSFYKINIKFPGIIDKPLSLLGEASYSIYLLHPIVYIIINGIYHHFSERLHSVPKISIAVLSILITLISSYFVYQKFEKYFMRLSNPRKYLPTTILDFQKSEI